MAKFAMGKLVWTRGVNEQVATEINFARFVTDSLNRHASGDWGELGEEDKQANQTALRDRDRLFSAYEKEGLPKIWIITEADRSASTILFPSEY